MTHSHGMTPANGFDPADNDGKLSHGIDAGGPFFGAAECRPSLI
jgi:hypothetical protein